MSTTKNESLAKTIAQTIISRLEISKYMQNEQYNAYINHLVDIGIGGFCIFNGSAHETKLIISELQSKSEVPLFFAADFENGLTMRLSDGTSFPHAMALGKTGNSDYTYRMAKAIALECKYLGVNWNFAPVCDVNSNPENPIINVRSFGESANEVVTHTNKYIQGIQEENILACAKHFPGHGDTGNDSHIKIPILNKSANQFKNNELIPFIEAIYTGVRSIMVGHLSVPTIDDTNLPASLSNKIVNDLLIKELGFSGLIVSDAMEMKAITDSFSIEYASQLAFNAGINVLLMPENIEYIINHLINLSYNNNILLKNIELSNEKILTEKNKLKSLFLNDTSNAKTFQRHEQLALEIAYNSIKLIGNKNLLPIPEKKQIAGFAVIQGDDINAPSQFFKLLAQAIENDCDFAYIDENISKDEISSLSDSIKNADLIIFAFFFTAKAYFGSVGITKRIPQIISDLASGRPTIAILFGSPYIAAQVPANLHVYTYSDSLASIASSVLYLCGRKLYLDNN